MSSPAVLITGALTGIGHAAAVMFAQEGARVVVSGRRDKQGQELVAELQGLGAEAIFVRSDVRKDEDVRNLVDQTVKRFGRLDIAVNNAGTEGLRGLITEQTAESYAATFDTNVLGVLLSMKHELRVMLPQGSGSIVNVSSAYGSVGAAGASVYVASKHGVEGMTTSNRRASSPACWFALLPVGTSQPTPVVGSVRATCEHTITGLDEHQSRHSSYL